MAKQNLNAAIRSLPEESPLVFRIWRRPFQLDGSLNTAAVSTADNPTKSVAKRDRLWLEEGGDARDMASLKARGKRANIAFSFDGAVTNTRDSLRLVMWAQKYGRNEELMTALGWRHFGEDEMMADRDVLLAACAEAGLDQAKALAVLDSDEFGDEVDGTHGKYAGFGREQGIPIIFFRCYHPHVNHSHRKRFGGSVEADQYALALRDIEMYATAPPAWDLAKPAAARYVVVHSPCVIIREDPTTLATVLTMLRPGAELAAYGIKDGVWLKLADEPGWAMIVSDAYGTLLEPVH